MSAEFDFLPGLDPSSLTSITQAQLLQMVSQIAPLSNKGGIIVGSGAGSAHPDVGNNNRYINYIWIDTQTANSPVLKLYTGTAYSDTYSDWSAFAVPNNSITTIMLQALAVTIAKLSSTGGVNGQLMKVNASGGFDFVDFSALLSNNIVPLTAINATSAGDGQVLQYKSSDGLVKFRTLDGSFITGNSLTLSQLANLGVYQFLVGDVNGVAVSLDALSVANAPNYIKELAIPLGKLAGTGSPATGDVLRWNGSAWAKSPSKYRSAATAIPATTVVATFAHGLTAAPEFISARIKNTVGELGYSIGDSALICNGDNGANGLSISADATNVYIIYNTNISITRRDTGARSAITAASWRYYVTAWND